MAVSVPEARLITLRQWPGNSGYGFVVDKKADEGYFKIKQVNPDTPAASVGVLENDLIIEINNTPAENITYEEVVDRIKSNPNAVKLMLLQPAEKDCLQARGYKLNSISCPLYIVEGRSAADETTKEVAEKSKLQPFESTLIRADAKTMAYLSNKRKNVLSTL
ncbi:unnamed protein product [Schistocephalus solidus]|uniref:PDZ domain-containing protein n=2 Tax=Schistocephalus solidus TaxID=70667 RepID=A0A183STH7_SCHSO|nr:unnamed protein product [Schistocephalus solidus]